MISNRISFGRKAVRYFIGYKDDKKVKPLCIMLPIFDAMKYMLFLIKLINFKSIMESRIKLLSALN